MEAQKQAKMIYQLEKEREQYGAEASDATAKYLQVGRDASSRSLWGGDALLLSTGAAGNRNEA